MAKRAEMKKEYGGSYIAEQSDEGMIVLLGGARFEGVALTTDQVNRLEKFYGYKAETDPNRLIEAGNGRNLMRDTRTDGLRVMAFLAKHGFLEEGEDVVTLLARAIDQDLFKTTPDIWNEDDENSL